MRTWMSAWMMPRKAASTLGRPGATMLVSATSTASARVRSGSRVSRSVRPFEPVSSSPSTRNRTLTGSEPRAASSASSAATSVNTWPLSSAVPRANRSPSRTVGSNGGETHSPIGSGGCTS